MAPWCRDRRLPMRKTYRHFPSPERRLKLRHLVFMGHARNVLQLETITLLNFGVFLMIDFGQEKLKRTNPQRTIAVELSIHNKLFIGL